MYKSQQNTMDLSLHSIPNLPSSLSYDSYPLSFFRSSKTHIMTLSHKKEMVHTWLKTARAGSVVPTVHRWREWSKTSRPLRETPQSPSYSQGWHPFGNSGIRYSI